MNLGVLVSGRGSNLQALLDASREGRIESRVALVISDVADAPALERAHQVGVPVLHVPAGPKVRVSRAAARTYVQELRRHDVDLIALAGFMRIVGRSFFAAYGGRIINIHPSLLPLFPGLDPQRQALEAGVRVAGCTVHFVTPDVDAGPIICQAAVPVEVDDSVDALSARILVEEHRIYVEAVQLLEEGRVHLEGARVRFGSAGPTIEGVSS